MQSQPGGEWIEPVCRSYLAGDGLVPCAQQAKPPESQCPCCEPGTPAAYANAKSFLADEFVIRRGADFQQQSCPPEIRKVGRGIIDWPAQITARH